MTRKKTWLALQRHREVWHERRLRDLFADDPRRFGRYSLTLDGLLFDYSKHLVDDDTLRLLSALAEQAGVAEQRERMFRGERVNVTENRPALHTALRQQDNTPVRVDGADVLPEIRHVQARMQAFANAVRSGQWLGYSGKRITDVVNIGIGGSHLGPEMAVAALQDRYPGPLRAHFVANVDPHAIHGVLESLEPASTLFIIASKTFTTAETLANARAARHWFLADGKDPAAVARHFVVVSANETAVREFGIDAANLYPMWDWVGGRYSLWSAIGLPIALALGGGAFAELLAGAYAVDRHFCSAPPAKNIPVLMALLGIWYGDFFAAQTHAVLPYRDSLKLFVNYLQQLEMESNGKRARLDGKLAGYATGAVLWGDVGTNAQHAFFQLLHQGGHFVPVDFILPLDDDTGIAEQQRMLIANCLAQSEALMRGKTAREAHAELAAAGLDEAQITALLPHKLFPGNRPSTTIVLDGLDARTLGMLVALYEHKVFVQSCIWNINPFDQWGVELGKRLAGHLDRELDGRGSGTHDASTAGLLDYIRRRR